MNSVNKTNSCSVLETTLQMLGAEKYLPIFKKYGIDTQTLGLLTEDDFKSIGIDDERLQKQIIRQCKNLPKRRENDDLCEINEEYIQIVLKDVEQHLRLLHACLSVCVIRQDIQLSDIKLNNCVKSVLHTTDSFGKELINCHNMFSPAYIKKNNKWKYVVALILTSTASMYTFKKFFFS